MASSSAARWARFRYLTAQKNHELACWIRRTVAPPEDFDTWEAYDAHRGFPPFRWEFGWQIPRGTIEDLPPQE